MSKAMVGNKETWTFWKSASIGGNQAMLNCNFELVEGHNTMLRYINSELAVSL